MAVDELELLDLSYAPPYSGVYDPLLVAARAATKVLVAADPHELARTQQRDELAAGAVETHRGDAALLEVEARPGEVVDDLGEVGLVADDQHALVGPGDGQQLASVVDIEAGEQRRVLERVDAQGLARQHRRVTRADLGAREAQVDVHLQRRQRAARDPRLLAPAIGEGAVGVRPRVVGLGLAVP